MEYLYRFEAVHYSPGCDEYGDVLDGQGPIELYLRTYKVLKETPCGAWIDVNFERKFVNLKANKKFACVTEKDAKISFIARKRRQIRILTNQLEDAKAELFMVLGQNTLFEISNDILVSQVLK